MTDPLKSPTCRECAMARGLRVPGDVRTVWRGVCANCGQEAYDALGRLRSELTEAHELAEIRMSQVYNSPTEGLAGATGSPSPFAARMTDEAVDRACRAYLAEDGAQCGEPNPWEMEPDTNEADAYEDFEEWKACQRAAMRAALAAFLAPEDS